jgi:predicted phage baseplate assembly protein
LFTRDTDHSPTTPAITLSSCQGGYKSMTWLPRRDLLGSKPFDSHFVVEIDDLGKAYLRFGDAQHGLRPPAGTEFSAIYRIGNGVQGNVGRETLYHIVLKDSRIPKVDGPMPVLKDNRITKVDNPMPASGGIDPQSIDDVRQLISQTFSTQERGVRPEDYKEIAEREPEVERANAILRWTGSWYTLFLTVERTGGAPVDDDFRIQLRKRMEYFRMAGADLVIVAPVYVSLEIEMQVQIQDTYIATNVKAALMEVFSNRRWPDGQQGIFYAGNYPFGTPVYLSDLYSAAYAIVGVQAVKITKFQRQGLANSSGLEDGVLKMDWLEIARMENDPSAPEHGVFGLITSGGVI